MFLSNDRFYLVFTCSLILISVSFLVLYCLGSISNSVYCWGASVWYLVWAILCWFLFPGGIILNMVFILICFMSAILNYDDQSIVGREGCSLLAMIAALYFFAKVLRDWPEKKIVPNLPVLALQKRKIPYRLRIIIFLRNKI